LYVVLLSSVFLGMGDLARVVTLQAIQPRSRLRESLKSDIFGKIFPVNLMIERCLNNGRLHYHIRERRVESFSRSISLPTMVQAEKVKAEFENGILTLTLPKVEEVKPKIITVKVK
jgi:hypothetical protein